MTGKLFDFPNSYPRPCCLAVVQGENWRTEVTDPVGAADFLAGRVRSVRHPGSGIA